jgi:serine/threonine-protein kinase HipA
MNKKVKIFVDGCFAGLLVEERYRVRYLFIYNEDYKGLPVSLTMPLAKKVYEFDRFPPFFDGLLPEGMMLEALLKRKKIDRYDCMSQLVAVGHDMVGNVTAEAFDV